MEIDLVHWENLCITTATGAAFHAEARTQRRLPENSNGFLSYFIQAQCKSDAYGSLADTCFCRTDGCDKDKAGGFHLLLIDVFQWNLGNVMAIGFQILALNIDFGSYLLYRLQMAVVGNLNVCQHDYLVFVYLLQI